MKLRSRVVVLIFVCLFMLLAAPSIAESRITNVSATASGCGIALNDNGTVWLWGSVSNNDPTGLQPIIMPGVDHVVGISGYLSPAVLKDDGTVWILRNYPYFENATLMKTWPDKEPVKVSGLSDVIAISGSINGGYGFDLLALKNDGTVWAIGSNHYGQQGTDVGYGNDNFLSLDAVQVGDISDVKAISMGVGHALALKKDGTVWAWGMNDMGQLGDGTISYDNGPGAKTKPIMVKGLTSVVAISAGNEFSMALKDDGTVWTWGRNTFGMLGDGVPGNVEERIATPVQVKGLANVRSISAGNWFALALKDDGTVWSWGDNRNFYMLGDYMTETRNVPGQIDGLSSITSISAGNEFCLALDNDGTVWAWGDDSAGQLGDGRQGSIRATPGIVSFNDAISNSTMEPASSGSPGSSVQASIPVVDNGLIDYMAADNGMIYAFTTNALLALDSNGVPKWNISIPGSWTYEKAYSIITDSHAKSTIINSINNTTTIREDENSSTGTLVKSVPIFTTMYSHIYLYALTAASDSKYQPMNGRTYLTQANKEVGKDLIAVAPDGRVVWTRHFVDDVAIQDGSHVEAHNGRIYLYHGYNETVLDSTGKIIFTIANVSGPASVDENGYVYTVTAVKQTYGWLSGPVEGQYFDYRTPSNVINVYAPNGVLSWSKVLEENVSQPYFLPSLWNDETGIPLYRNGTLYIPVDKGIIAMNKHGEIVWTKMFADDYKMFYLMTTDAHGNLYLYYRQPNGSQTIMSLKPDGTEIEQVDVGSFIPSADNGILYENGRPFDDINDENVNQDNLEKATIRAYDINRGIYEWNFTTPIEETHTVTVNESNVLTLFPDYISEGLMENSITTRHSEAEIIPAGDLTYIYFRTAAWDDPVVYNKSVYTYYSALYALDKNGKLVWQKPMDSFLTAAVANNSTIYYGTDNGKISVSVVEVAAGFVLIGSALILMFGYISRARSKIDKNENRNRIFQFIFKQPGSTIYEITRGTGMNMGTVRYHMMILDINHRIVSFNDEGKFVRYFTNSNSYSKEDQLVISVMRRDSIGRMLRLISERQETTNADLCNELGMQESAVSKYLGELSRKGILARDNEQNIRTSYSIKKEYVASVMKAVKLMESNVAPIQSNESETSADALA